MTHVEALDCPCGLETRDQLGGGRVQVHRDMGDSDGRRTDSFRSPDRHCERCDGWHLLGHPHFEPETLRTLEREVMDLKAEGRRHVGMFVERAAVMRLLDPRRRKKAA